MKAKKTGWAERRRRAREAAARAERRQAARRKAGRLATGAGLILGGTAVAAGALYTEVMTSVVARRRSLLSDTVITVATGHLPDDHDPIYDEWAAALEAMPWEPVQIRSHDDYVLRARWLPVEGAKRTVILAHGWHSRWNLDFCGIAPFLREKECDLLLIDQRCHGESGGDLISYGIRERHDILSWLDWVEAHHAGLPVYLCGVSMGAATVLMAAGLPIAGRVQGIIADCGYSTPQETIKLTLEKSIGRMAGPTLAAVNLNCKLRENFTFKDYTPIEAMAENREVPCFFIHGDADRLVPFRMSVENYYACQAPKDLLIVHGAEHAMSFVVDPDTYKARLLAFFEAYDTPPVRQKKKRRLFRCKRKGADA